MEIFGITGVEAAIALVIVVVVLAVVATIVVQIVRGGLLWRRDHTGPQETHTATLVAKRAKSLGGGHDTPVRTQHFVTLESPTGERREWRVREELYAVLVEGDTGECLTQGGRLVALHRQAKLGG